ncbi:hypothetical protein LPJ53_004847 [Coemansia erecta]|uniref:Guanine deaminase n=1 Tax=Coemansia erecta TaxID=147472 RepID=A0A9W7XXL1_9FUNG|nr:hypothetical protein LPJ53_004847 [Coemansia erecta]
MSGAPRYTVFLGCLVDTPTFGTLRIRHDAALGVDHSTGRILGIEEKPALSPHKLVEQWTGSEHPASIVATVRLTADQFLMPGLIDTHTHAPQFTFLGIGHDLPLMDWLEKYTFKHESEFKDTEVARQFYHTVVDRVLANGVTFAAYYGTIHLESNRVLAETIRKKGQRAYVGKVCMDMNSPDYYVETTEETLEGTEAFIRGILDNKQERAGLVQPIVTPRFAPTCSQKCLSGLGALARKYNVPVQSHLCENPSEISFAQQCFPESTSYADIYGSAGLLGPRTIMAHCVHMSTEDLKALRQAGAGVSHCPTSNFALGSGLADVRKLLANGLRVGLGTDVGGGYSPSMLDAMRMACAANRALLAAKREKGEQLVGREGVPLDAGEVLFLATQGGADVMGMGAELGSLDAAKLFDALVVDLAADRSPVPSVQRTPAVACLHDAEDAWHVRLEQFVFLADDRNIARVYVDGRLVHSV